MFKIPILALFAMRSPCWTGRISLKFYEIPPEKKKEDLTSISEKVNICYTFDEKKVNNNFFGFLANFDHLEKMSQISKNLVNFSCFWSNLHYYYKTFFKISQKIITFTKNGENQQKVLSQPYDFLIFESQNVHSRAESV